MKRDEEKVKIKRITHEYFPKNKVSIISELQWVFSSN